MLPSTNWDMRILATGSKQQIEELNQDIKRDSRPHNCTVTFTGGKMYNSLAFLRSIDVALELAGGLHYTSRLGVYLVEDDHLHHEDALLVMVDGFLFGKGGVHEKPDMVTMYDHPDKYVPKSVHLKPVSTCKNCGRLPGAPSDEANGCSSTALGLLRHWRGVRSTVMTWAVRGDRLQDVADVIKRVAVGWKVIPSERQMFHQLHALNMTLVSCIPGAVTHVEPAMLSPLVDWHEIVKGHCTLGQICTNSSVQ